MVADSRDHLPVEFGDEVLAPSTTNVIMRMAARLSPQRVVPVRATLEEAGQVDLVGVRRFSMTESNVDRLREAVARVEELLKGLEAPSPGVANRTRAQVEAAELRVSAAADLERILTEARQLAKQLHAEERDTAQALVTEARGVAGELRAEDRRTAVAMVAEAEEVAEELHSVKRHAAEVLVAEAEEVAEELHSVKRHTAEAMVTEAEQVADELDSEGRRAAAVLSEAGQVAEQSHRDQAPRGPETQ
jgi:DNA repair exonuclease SbcCD ATPase subunit